MITKVPMDMLFSQNTGTYGAALQRNQNFWCIVLARGWSEYLRYSTISCFKEERRQKSAFFTGIPVYF